MLNTKKNALNAFFSSAQNILHDEILSELKKLGNECVVMARNRPEGESWYNRSGNLRSSVGHAVYDKGKKIMESAFQQVLGGFEGVTKGRQMVEDLAKEYARVYALAVVAAMPYASDVEAMDNKVVLASAELFAISKTGVALKKAIETASGQINSLKL